MKQVKLDNKVIVFDLDDTLFFEKDYQKSGFKNISIILKKLYKIDAAPAFENNLESKNILESVLIELKLPQVILSSLIDVYRFHEPEINVCKGVLELLNTLKSKKIPMYIITDGRGLSQRQKIEALGISHFFNNIYISQEQGVGKPNASSFKKIMAKHLDSNFVYIGDNPKKDFIAAKELGWLSIGVKHLEKRVHPLEIIENPDIWIEEIDELRSLLC